MAKELNPEDTHGFKVIAVDRKELLHKLGKLGSKGICDYCARSSERGYIVSVLDQWLCPECYAEFLQSSPAPYIQDAPIEDIHHQYYLNLFNI